MSLSAISITPVVYAVLTLDYCARDFGSAPCAATGTKCYKTYFTCKDRANYSKTTKDYAFSSFNAPLPFPGPRPYIESVKYLPTEIKDNLTVSALTTITMRDEPELTDIGLDPYYADRTTIQGTFWRKFVARNPNYKGRPVKIYEENLGEALGSFVQRVEGVIENISFDERGGVTVQVKDLLASLADIEIPEKIDVKLGAAVDATQTSWSLDGAYADLPASDFYARCDDEIVYIATLTGNQATGLTRGALGTTADSHSQGNKIQQCRYYAPQSAYDILTSMLLTDAGLDAAFVDSTAFAVVKAFDSDMPYFSALIDEPTKLRDLYFEIINMVDCKSWVAEDLKITILKNLPNYPGRTTRTLTDPGNIIEKTLKPDLNAKSRVGSIVLYWGKGPGKKDNEPASYQYWDIFEDGDGNSANAYNEDNQQKIFCRWLSRSYMDEDLVTAFIRRVGARMLRLKKNPMPILSFAVTLKDGDIKTGEFVTITTSALQEADGSDVSGIFQIIRRDRKATRVECKAIRYPKSSRIFFIQSATGAADYTSADAARKEYGFICGSDGLMSDGDEGYRIY